MCKVNTTKDIRLNTTKDVKKNIEIVIDPENRLGLGARSIERIELYTFAMAMGKSMPPLELNTTESLIRRSTIDSTPPEAYIYASFIENKCKNDQDDTLDQILKTDEVYSLADQYANRGFQIIFDYLNNPDEDNEKIIFELIKNLDEKYEELKKKFPKSFQ